MDSFNNISFQDIDSELEAAWLEEDRQLLQNELNQQSILLEQEETKLNQYILELDTSIYCATDAICKLRFQTIKERRWLPLSNSQIDKLCEGWDQIERVFLMLMEKWEAIQEFSVQLNECKRSFQQCSASLSFIQNERL